MAESERRNPKLMASEKKTKTHTEHLNCKNSKKDK